MTIVGKLLVFINLVFSLIVGYLVILVHSNAVRSDLVNTKLKKDYEVARASENSYKTQNEGILKEKARLSAALEKQGVKESEPIAWVIDNLVSQISANKADIEALKKIQKQTSDSLVEKNAELEAMKQVVKNAEAAAKRTQDDYEKLRITLFAEQKNSTILINDKTEAERKAAQDRIERNNALDRASQLEKENRTLAEDLIRLKSAQGAPALISSTSPNGKNPPTTRVEGKVTKVEADLIKLNVGSDRGLKEGNTLEVFRLSSIPNQSRYLGTLRIMKVDPYEAVGQMMSRPSEAVRVGDDVAPTTSFQR